jgi:prepilin-type N-terminal cleavage/methylation domain-containing protein
MHLEPSRKSGFTLVETLIVLAIISLLLGVAIPSFVKAREAAQLKSVVMNLRHTEGANGQMNSGK